MMEWFNILMARLRALFRRESVLRDIEEELRLHVEIETETNIRRGMPPDEARAAALKSFGNLGRNTELGYDIRGGGWLETLWQDLRYGARMLRKQPGFSVAAILSLALGIGANTAIFSVVNAVLIRPLSYPEPESLVGVFNSGVIQGETFNDMGLAPGMYAGLKERSKTFQEFGVWESGTATVTGIVDPEQIKTISMTQGVLPALGAQPFLGRQFSVEDDTPGTPETVILSHSYWMRRFGGDERALGRTVMIDFVPRQVIGVMPRTFRFLDLSPDVLLPQRFAKVNPPFGDFSYSGIARLKPGITIDLANQDATRVLNQIIPENIRPFAEQARLKSNLRPLKRDVTGDIGTVLGVVMGALGLVFLLVCANVANLVLVRAQARTQEFAIRAALGAGWWRVARGLLVECLILGLIGAAFGIALAYGAVQILKAQDLTTIPRLAEVSIDAATVAFDLACSVAGSLLFGLIAVFKCGIPGNIISARGASMRPDQLRAQNALVVAQVALALVLLVASGLLIRTFLALRGVHPGFRRPERVQTMRIVIPDTQAPEPERVARMQADIVENVSRLPGVETAAFADGLPMDAGHRNGNPIAVEDKFTSGQTPPNRRIKYVSPGLFAAQGTRLLAGRDFTWEDLSKRRLVAIVSESMARENWGEPNAALGKRLGSPGAWSEVVGVVEDVHDNGADRPAPPIVYFRTGVYAWSDRPPSIRRGLTLAVRSSRANTESFLREVATAIHAVNPNLPLAQVRTLDDVYRRSMARTSFTLALLGIAGTMALALAVIGVYGVLAYAVGQRRREVSIRVALGARPNQVTGLFLRRGILLACVGGIVGVAAAMGLSRWVSSLLFGVTALDPATYVASALIVSAAALIASYIPARRALSVNPTESLRAD
ncbi:MAG TPA: ABC transporter permease [Blastocatellia bacterium]|jgi:predicted permease|nr:ABC transporter permease [Blastocatellia bacterium]